MNNIRPHLGLPLLLPHPPRLPRYRECRQHPAPAILQGLEEGEGDMQPQARKSLPAPLPPLPRSIPASQLPENHALEERRVSLTAERSDSPKVTSLSILGGGDVELSLEAHPASPSLPSSAAVEGAHIVLPGNKKVSSSRLICIEAVVCSSKPTSELIFHLPIRYWHVHVLSPLTLSTEEKYK